MSDKSDHWHVGREHASNGEARYKFQDKYLQREYDAGYDGWYEQNGGLAYDYDTNMPGRFDNLNKLYRRR